MPVEFAVAAYRFGHCIIRPFYVINQTTLERGGVPVFGPDGGFNLNGGRPIPSDLVMEWKNILPVDPDFPPRKPRKIDTRLSLPLSRLPDPSFRRRTPQRQLAVRNKLRGKQVGLPSGQQVAKTMRAPVLSELQLGLSTDPGWEGEAPLWYYILKEAELPPNNESGSGPLAAGSSPKCWSGCCSGTRAPTSTSTRPGSPHPLSRLPAVSSVSSSCSGSPARHDCPGRCCRE